jgi:Molybdopterin oxidoreductase Fe4S4 domain/Oxidoreductase family, C-terminal alpha/beta domain
MPVQRTRRAGYYVSLEITAPAERVTAISAADDKLAYEQHSMEALVKAICRNCHGGCSTVVRVKNGVVTELAGDASNPINRGKLCVKAGVASLEQFGEIHSLQAVSSNAVRGFAVEDTAAVLLRFHSGAIGAISVSDTAVSPFSWDLASGELDLMLGTSDQMKRQKVSSHVFAGTEGSLTLPTLHYYNYREVAEPSWRSDLNAEVLVAESADTYLRQIEHFARVIRREEAPLVSGLDGVRTLQATLAVKEAAATGHTIMLSE